MIIKTEKLFYRFVSIEYNRMENLTAECQFFFSSIKQNFIKYR